MAQAHTGTKRRILIGVLSALLLIAGLSARSLWRSAHDLCVTQYTLTEDTLTAPLCIVQLTDLHNSVFGEGNERVIQPARRRIQTQKTPQMENHRRRWWLIGGSNPGPSA